MIRRLYLTLPILIDMDVTRRCDMGIQILNATLHLESIQLSASLANKYWKHVYLDKLVDKLCRNVFGCLGSNNYQSRDESIMNDK